MEKDKKILIAIIGVILVIASIVTVIAVKKYNDSNKNNDAIKFKEEYESLNKKENENNGEIYLSLNISKNNPIKYATEEDIIKVLESGSGVIYFGFPNCPWCRSMIETLLESAAYNKVNKIYYLNILDIRDTYSIENGELLQTRTGTDNYYKILELLDENLSDYSLGEEGKEYKTGVKRLYAPTVVWVKDGKVIGFKEDVVDDLVDPYPGLNDKQKKTLKKEYQKVFKKYNSTTCTSKAC